MSPARVPTAEAREQLAKIVRRSARGERIKLTRYGKTQAVLIPKHDLEALEDCEDEKVAKVGKKAPPGTRVTRRRR
jgi:prevent-host-death family protein